MAEPSWQEWIVGNLSAGCDPADMQARMTKAGWSEADARAALATGIAQLFPGLQPSARPCRSCRTWGRCAAADATLG
ncbi:MAG: hypothetical protein IPG54_08695 [Sphingomonadales bacterium]|nr:hypothetical protein [Sphingomonadales bacterium]